MTDSRHPFRDAYLPESGDGAAGDVAQAIETYTPLVVLSVDAITSRDLSWTKHIVLLTGNSIRFYKQEPENTDEEDGDTVIWDMEDLPFVLVQRGDRYDMPLGTTGLLGDAEVLPATAIPTQVVVPAGMPGSLAIVVGTPPTGSKTISYQYSIDDGVTWLPAFSIAIAAGARRGTFTLVADLVLPAESVLQPVAPATHDPTMTGLTVTVVARR